MHLQPPTTDSAPPPALLSSPRPNQAPQLEFARLCLLLALILLVYQQAVGLGLVWDDPIFVHNDPITLSSEGWRLAWTETSRLDYYPVTATLFWAIHQSVGASYPAYHGVNLLLHLLACVLLWRLLRRLHCPVAWWVALLFGIHPVTVATVAWISEIKNTLAQVFLFASLWCYMDHRERGRALDYVWSVLLFALATLSKASVVVLPALLVLLEWFWGQRSGRLIAKRTAVFFLITLATSVIHVIFQQGIGIDQVRRLPVESLPVRLVGVGWIVWFYVLKTVLPTDLCMIYARWEVDPTAWTHHLPNALLLAAVALGWAYRRSWYGRLLLFWLGYLLVTLAPVLGVIRMVYHRMAWVSDHLQYLTLPGTLTALALLGWRLCLRPERPVWARRLGLLLGLGVLGAFSATTWRLLPAFQDLPTMWAHNVAVSPDSAFANYYRAKDLERLGQRTQALQLYDHVLKLAPGSAVVMTDRAMCLASLNQLSQAQAQLEAVLRHQPHDVQALENLGTVKYLQNDYAGAIATMHAALAHDPDSGRAERTIALALVKQDQPAAAQPWIEKAIAHDPGNVQYRQQYVELLLQLDQPWAAGAQLRQALELAGHDAATATWALGLEQLHAQPQPAAWVFLPLSAQVPRRGAYHQASIGCLLKLQRTAAARLHSVMRALLDPTDAAAVHRDATYWDRAGAADTAAFLYRRAYLLNPRELVIANDFGVLLARQGDLIRARGVFLKVLEIDPQNEDARHNVQKVSELLQQSAAPAASPATPTDSVSP